MLIHLCINCQNPVFIWTAAAWPERCPYCGAVPFATASSNLARSKQTEDSQIVPLREDMDLVWSG